MSSRSFIRVTNPYNGSAGYIDESEILFVGGNDVNPDQTTIVSKNGVRFFAAETTLEVMDMLCGAEQGDSVFYPVDEDEDESEQA